MYKYKLLVYRAGITIEVIKCIPRGQRKGQMRGPKKTPEEMRTANMRQAARKLARKINANFRPGDWHVTLTYRPSARPTPEDAKKNMDKLIAVLRAEYRKHGFALKYIHATEYRNKAIHHHLVVNNVNDGRHTTSDYIRKAWKGRGNPKFVSLYDNGEYRQLADYLIKETEKTFRDGDSPVKQRYSCSRNLIDPKPEVRMVSVKKGWEMDPRPRPGYYIDRDTLYNGTDKLGYPYQRYVMIRIMPEDGDWETAEWPPVEGMKDTA